MAHSVKLLFSAPDAETVETASGLWAFSGVRTDALRRLLSGVDAMDDVVDRLTEVTEDAAVVRISNSRDRGRVDAFRSVTATRDLYYLRGSDGHTVVTDDFRTALAHVDVSDRHVSREAIADHLLFGWPVEPRTYLNRVRAVGQGERVTWHGNTGRWDRRRVDVLDREERTDPSTVPTRLAECLDALPAERRDGDRLVVDDDVESALLYAAVDDPDAFVVDDGSGAFTAGDAVERTLAQLGDGSGRRVSVDASGLLSNLERTVDNLGAPPGDARTVQFDAALREGPPGRFVSAEGAAALFGLPGIASYRRADSLRPALSPRLTDLTPELFGGIAEGYEALVDRASHIDRPVANPDSAANRLAFSADADAVATLLDPDIVTERYRRQAEYVRRRAAPTDQDRFARQAEFGHLLRLFGDRTVGQWRQLGAARGQRFLTPFSARRLVRCSLSTPARRRYVEGPDPTGSFERKHHLTELLSEWGADEAVDTPGDAGSASLDDPVARDLLTEAFDRYEAPTFAAESAALDGGTPGRLTWPLVGFAVWRDRVLVDPDVSPASTSVRRHVRVASEPPAP